MDNAIQEFLSKKKVDWTKKKISQAMAVEEVLSIEQQAANAFILENWLPDAANRASQLSLVSHPSKFSHPGSKTTAIIAEKKRTSDGFFRTGNVHADLDIFGNAAAMDVFKFLSLKLSDEMTILEHLQRNTEKIKEELTLTSVPFETLRAKFLSIKKVASVTVTSESVKQVYFPVADNYHLLSILTPSGLVFELRKRIDNIRFSEQAKKAREDKRNNIYNEIGFDDLYDLAVIGYGGTKPQNISVLNNNYGGKAYLLQSIPPLLTKQKQHLPKHNFFTNCLWSRNFEPKFIKLHKLLTTDHNNKDIRDGMDRRIQAVIDGIIEKMWSVRLQPGGWSAGNNYLQLPDYQKIWLDTSRKEDRQIDDPWLKEVISDCARWIILTYEKVLGNKAVLLGDDELIYIKSIIASNKEDLL